MKKDPNNYSRAPIVKPCAAEEELVRCIHRKVGGPAKLSTYDDPAKVRHVVIEALANEQRTPADAARIRKAQLSVFERRVVRTVTNRGAAVRSRMRQRKEMAHLRHQLHLRDVRVQHLQNIVRALCSAYSVPLPAAVTDGASYYNQHEFVPQQHQDDPQIIPGVNVNADDYHVHPTQHPPQQPQVQQVSSSSLSSSISDARAQQYTPHNQQQQSQHIHQQDQQHQHQPEHQHHQNAELTEDERRRSQGHSDDNSSRTRRTSATHADLAPLHHQTQQQPQQPQQQTQQLFGSYVNDPSVSLIPNWS